MACKSQSIRRRLPVYSDGDPGATAIFVPFHTGRCADTGTARIHYVMTGTTGSLRVATAIRYSNDGLTWDTPTVYGTYATTLDTWVYASTYQTTNAARQWFQIGITARNTTGVTGPMTMATVDAVIDTRSR